jgi:hypothetical protein
MAKEQKRGSREAKKPKTADKGSKAGPKYMTSGASAPLSKVMAPPAPRKK